MNLLAVLVEEFSIGYRLLLVGLLPFFGGRLCLTRRLTGILTASVQAEHTAYQTSRSRSLQQPSCFSLRGLTVLEACETIKNIGHNHEPPNAFVRAEPSPRCVRTLGLHAARRSSHLQEPPFAIYGALKLTRTNTRSWRSLLNDQIHLAGVSTGMPTTLVNQGETPYPP